MHKSVVILSSESAQMALPMCAVCYEVEIFPPARFFMNNTRFHYSYDTVNVRRYVKSLLPIYDCI